VGTSYQTLLVVAEPADVRDDLAAAGHEGLVMPAGPGRTAVMPREDEWEFAHVDDLAAQLGARHGWAALANVVQDSDVVLMLAYRAGALVHEYVSDESMMVDDLDLPDEPVTPGPKGADPAALASFGVGDVDLDRLGACLRGEAGDDADHVFAERQHWLILEALNLDPRGLTVAFRHAGDADLPGAERVQPQT
jgi:hypothetical protein